MESISKSANSVGYRSQFHELQENPKNKLKLLPQDSNASEIITTR